MTRNVSRATLYSAVLTLLLVSSAVNAMSGMDMPHGGHVNATSSLSQNLGEPINSSEAEIEMTYSAEGKTAIFVSGRNGSVPSPGVPYNFDIWMAHKVNGAWQVRLTWDQTSIPPWGRTSIRPHGNWSQAYLMTATLFISRDTSPAISPPATSM